MTLKNALKHPPSTGVLAVWDNIHIKSFSKAFEEPVFILKYKNLEKGLVKILETHLEL